MTTEAQAARLAAATARATKATTAAVKAMADGFTSKAGQKRTLDRIGLAYDEAREALQSLVLDIEHDDRTEEQLALYWALPTSLGNWRPKHADAAVGVYPDQAPALVALIEELAAMRSEIKDSVINAPAKPETNERAERAIKSLREILEARGEQYANAIKLGEIFGRLPVTASAHGVTNQHGTFFMRTFFYLAGKLTPLNVICAAAEEIERRKEEKAAA